MAIDPQKKKLICCGYAVAQKALEYSETALINEEDLPPNYPVSRHIRALENMAEVLKKWTSEVPS